MNRYLENRESCNIKVYVPKFPPMTHVKDCPKFECNIYLDTDVHSAISVSSAGNSQSFTVLTDRLAFVNFSSTEAEAFIRAEAAIIRTIALGPVVQSIVSLMSSLRGQLIKCFTTL